MAVSKFSVSKEFGPVTRRETAMRLHFGSSVCCIGQWMMKQARHLDLDSRCVSARKAQWLLELVKF